MRRIIAPQAIRTMIPAFGNETVSALKNSSLASVISVQELTLRSTQLASSTFDFFSIFFASGLIYLVLTTRVSLIQLFVERLLDLDRPATQDRLTPLSAVVRAPLVLEAAGTSRSRQPRDRDFVRLRRRRRKGLRSDRTRRSAALTHNEVVVDVRASTRPTPAKPCSPGSI